MLDTIALTLQQDSFMIIDHDKFSPSTRGLFEKPYYRLGGRGSYSCYQNPTKSALEAGNYSPRLTATKRSKAGGFQITLRIELSLPKLFYGNNFAELRDDYIITVADIIKAKLWGMGVYVARGNIIWAAVSAIHYSKNFILTDYTTPEMIINELRKINLTKQLDLTESKFRNGGLAWTAHTNSYELALYDKRKDLEHAKKSEKRSLEDDNALQLGLLDELPEKEPYEVLRYEVRIGNRTKLKRVLKDCAIDTKPTLRDLCRSDVAQTVLKHFWGKLTAEHSVLATDISSPAQQLKTLIRQYPTAPRTKLLEVALARLVISEVGARQFRAMVETGRSDRNWQRFHSLLRQLPQPKPSSYDVFGVVVEQLEQFEPAQLPANNRYQKV